MSELKNQNTSIIIGSNGGIAKALVSELLHQQHRLFTISRRENTKPNALLTHFCCDHSETQIKNTVQFIAEQTTDISHVYICLGQLHDENYQPEKQLEQINSEYAHQLFEVNTVLPMLWLQSLMPLLIKQHQCKVTVLSARVGSISDNRLGGWYSYRASKAALNMMLKTAAVEFKRRAKGVKLIAFHPGTTDTALSKPFQARVPKGKLFTPEFVAKQLVKIAQQQNIDGELSYLDWQGESIEY